MLPKARLLLVDDDPNTLASLSRAFRMAGYEAAVCDSAARALELLKTELFDVILSDVVMPGKDGLTFLEELKAAGVKSPVIMISGQANIEIAVRATRLGAMDFLEKPLSTDKLLVTVDNALRFARLADENFELRRRLGKHEIIWQGPAMQRVMAQVDRVAASQTRVCILGETGTGKELVARAIHEKSPRREGPFVTLNCAAVPAELIESELFGHEKGSFTGATGRHLGKFEQAHRGTFFLDEIGDMPLAMQAKLLRVLEENEVERVGSEKPVAVDARVIVATHRNLDVLVRQNAFRRDLYHRVYVFPLILPPLRERLDDFIMLTKYFAEQIAQQNSWKIKSFSPAAISELQRYPWPGNLRELRNVTERLVLLSAGDTILPADVHLALPHDDPTAGRAVGLPETGPGSAAERSSLASGASLKGTLNERMAVLEREVLLAELRRHNYHMTNVSKALGLERSHLYKKCEQLGIDLQALRKLE